jgi:hypothetical protein
MREKAIKSDCVFRAVCRQALEKPADASRAVVTTAMTDLGWRVFFMVDPGMLIGTPTAGSP